MLDLDPLVGHSHAMILSHDASALEEFILNRMRMSHIYQPVMLKVLLEGSGTASLEHIAKALLSYDLPQIEYYGLHTKRILGDKKLYVGDALIKEAYVDVESFMLSQQAVPSRNRAPPLKSRLPVLDSNIAQATSRN